MKQFAISAFLVFSLVLLSSVSYAQCSMCRAVAESEFNTLAEGLNNGILYLMGVPYILLIGSAIYLFRKPKH